MNKIIILMLAILATVSVTGCKKETTETPAPNPIVVPDSSSMELHFHHLMNDSTEVDTNKIYFDNAGHKLQVSALHYHLSKLMGLS